MDSVVHLKPRTTQAKYYSDPRVHVRLVHYPRAQLDLRIIFSLEIKATCDTLAGAMCGPYFVKDS